MAIEGLKGTSQVFFDAVPSAVYQGALYAPGPFDTVQIGPYRTPGIAKVDVSVALRKQQNKKPGSSGARHIIFGREIATFKISVTVWTPLQKQTLDELVAIVFPKKLAGSPSGQRVAQVGITSSGNVTGAGVDALFDAAAGKIYPSWSIFHPALSQLQITAGLCTGVQGYRSVSPGGPWNLDMHWEEYALPSKDKVSPKPSTPREVRKEFSPGNNPPALQAQPGVNYSPSNGDAVLPSKDPLQSGP